MLYIAISPFLSLFLSPLDRDFFHQFSKGSTGCARGRTISRKPRLIALLPGAKYSVRILASLSPFPFPFPSPQVALNASWKLDRGWTMENVPPATERRARADETRALFCMNFYEISRHKTRDNPIGTRVRRVPVTGHKFRSSALVPGRVRN